MVQIRMVRGQWRVLAEALFARRDVESKVFALCGATGGGPDVLLSCREVIPVPEAAYEERSAARVVTRREFVHGLLTRCQAEGLSLLEAHSHPFAGEAAFSGIDDRSDARKFRATETLPPEFRHATMVFAPDGSFAGRLWDREIRRALPIDRLTVSGVPLHRLEAGDTGMKLGATLLAVYDRQIRAFGEAGQQLLAGLTVALIGLGGLGSQVFQTLALLGVGRFVLIDPDALEESNANRVVGVTAAQVRKGRAKVEALAQNAPRLYAAPPQVRAVRADVRDPAVWPQLLEADVVVGAVDSAAVRGFLNAFCAGCLLPYVDGGVGVQAKDGRIAAAGGQVRTVLPGETPCLACRDREAQARAVEEHTPQQRALSLAAGYIHGEAIPAPQVAFLNGVIANALAWEVVKLATGCLPAYPYVYYDLVQAAMFRPTDDARRDNCLVCGAEGLLGLGARAATEFVRAGEGSPPPPPRERKGEEDGTDPVQ